MVEFDCKYRIEILIPMIGIQIINIDNLSFCDFQIMAGTQKNLVSCVLSTKKHGCYFRKKTRNEDYKVSEAQKQNKFSHQIIK